MYFTFSPWEQPFRNGKFIQKGFFFLISVLETKGPKQWLPGIFKLLISESGFLIAIIAYIAS